MEFSPDSRWVGPNHSRAPTQIREVAQFEADHHSANSPRWSQSRAVEEFSQCRHESPQHPGSSGGVGRRRNQCTGRAPGGAPTCQSSITTFGTILPKSRHHNGGSSVEGVQVGAGFGRIGGHQWSRGRCNQESPRESQSSCTRPNTVEEAALWMRCRQEMEEAISMGREADVSRLACVIAEGAVQLRQWTQPPSSVGNMVS